MVIRTVGRLKVLEMGPGWSSHVQAIAIRLVHLLMQPFRRRGIGYVIQTLGRIFPKTNYLVANVFGSSRVRLPLYDGYWLAPLIRGDVYEPDVATVISAAVSEDVAFFDCGANIGYWSIFAGGRSRGAPVVAIEPSPLLFPLLEENAALNGQTFHCVNNAIWRRSGQVLEMAVDLERHSWGTVDGAVKERLADAGFEHVRVPSITLDELSQQFLSPGQRVVIKLDVEGAELDALHGSYLTLQRDPLIIFEQHGRDSSTRVSKWLTSRGYEVFIQSNVKTRGEVDPGKGYNHFAARPHTSFHQLLTNLSFTSAAENR